MFVARKKVSSRSRRKTSKAAAAFDPIRHRARKKCYLSGRVGMPMERKKETESCKTWRRGCQIYRTEEERASAFFLFLFPLFSEMKKKREIGSWEGERQGNEKGRKGKEAEDDDDDGGKYFKAKIKIPSLSQFPLKFKSAAELHS